MNLKDKIRIVEGFPKEGISFKDITTLIGDGEAFKESIDSLNASPSPINVVISLKLIPSLGNPSTILILSFKFILTPP